MEKQRKESGSHPTATECTKGDGRHARPPGNGTEKSLPFLYLTASTVCPSFS